MAVFVARFVPGVRFTAGPLAGALGLRFASFLVANVADTLLYMPVVVGAGYAVGCGFGAYVRWLRYLVGEVERIVLLIVLVGILDLGAACVVQGVRRRDRTCVAAATGRGAGPVTAASRLSGLRLPRSRRSPAGAPRCPE